ncbi:BTB/POZ domain-containing protein [Phthorimaea operculella]|nr:BTB/POZ domain-containing protein [Phthorimaea operculella]
MWCILFCNSEENSLLKVIDVRQTANILNLKLKSDIALNDVQVQEISPEIILCGSDNLTYSVSLVPLAKPQAKQEGYKRSENLVDDENFEGASWHVFYEKIGANVGRMLEYNLKIALNVSCKMHNGFSLLYDDTDLSDFELRGTDGSIKVHKAVLAHYSPVMKTMLSGQWKEVKAGAVDIPNTSSEILEQFKNFIYLHKLPENEIEKLAELASCYMISQLEEVCTYKLLTSLTSENVTKTLELAGKCKMDRVMVAALAVIQQKSIKVKDILLNYETIWYNKIL